MPDYFDALETRSRDERSRDQLVQLREQVGYARSKSTAYAEILAEVDPDSLADLSDLKNLPVTRKSSLIERQAKQRPFGGLASEPISEVRHIFASPGPIYEPEGYNANYWRLARALFAAGFRLGDIAYNTFSYHFTPAGSILESAIMRPIDTSLR